MQLQNPQKTHRYPTEKQTTTNFQHKQKQRNKTTNQNHRKTQAITKTIKVKA